jgi:hypothetical protein
VGWYVELHCDRPNGCPHGATEEGPQGRDKRAVASEAKRLGWKQRISGAWWCAGCVADHVASIGQGKE